MEICEGVYAPQEFDIMKDKGWAKNKKARYTASGAAASRPP